MPGLLRITSSEVYRKKRICLASILPATGQAWNVLGDVLIRSIRGHRTELQAGGGGEGAGVGRTSPDFPSSFLRPWALLPLHSSQLSLND